MTTRITHSHSVNQRRRREQEAERTLARARRASMEAQKFQETVEHLREVGVLPPTG